MAQVRTTVLYDLTSLARNKNNEPLSDGTKQLLYALLDCPTQALWDRCRNAILANPKDGKPISLWRAVIAVDPTFQNTAGPRDADNRTTWDRLPTIRVLEDAIRWATH